MKFEFTCGVCGNKQIFRNVLDRKRVEDVFDKWDNIERIKKELKRIYEI